MRQIAIILLLASCLFAETTLDPFWASKKINGGYVVKVLSGSDWEAAGTLKFTVNYKTGEIALPVNADGPVHVRLQPLNKNIAHFDALDLNGQAPVSVQGMTKAELALISNSDYNVANMQGVVDAVFETTAENPVLRLRARVDPDEFFGLPTQVPEQNLGKTPDQFEQYRIYKLGSRPGSLLVNGELNDEDLGEPLFVSMVNPCTGHPSGNTWGWVQDDGKNLYVALDFTSDNTFDGDPDYASVHIRDHGEIKTFRASVPEQTWGTSGFTYTDKVPYRHKTYEFAIPLQEIGPSENIELAFELYGTVAITFPQPNSLIDDLGDYGSGSAYPVTTPVELTNNDWWSSGYSDYDAGSAALTLGPGVSALLDFTSGIGPISFAYDLYGDGAAAATVVPGPQYFDLSDIASIDVNVSTVTGPILTTLNLVNSSAATASVGPISLTSPVTTLSLAGVNPAVRSDVGAIQILFSGSTSIQASITSVMNGSDAPLPVSLTSFYAQPLSSGIELFWQTASEIDVTGYYIDRKSAGSKDYTRISGLIPGKGNTTSSSQYSFMDEQTESEHSYVYRLVSVDLQGGEKVEDQIVARMTDGALPDTPSLSQNFPNPFNPATTIEYTLPEATNVTVQIFNATGSLVRTLVDGASQAGIQTIAWNGLNESGQAVGSGLYICRMTAGNFVQTRRMQLVR